MRRYLRILHPAVPLRRPIVRYPQRQWLKKIGGGQFGDAADCGISEPRSPPENTWPVVKVSFIPPSTTQQSKEYGYLPVVDVAVFRAPKSGKKAVRVSAIKRLSEKNPQVMILPYDGKRDSFFDTFYLVWASSFGQYLTPSTFSETPANCWLCMNTVDLSSWSQKVQVSGSFGIGNKTFIITPDKYDSRFMSLCAPALSSRPLSPASFPLAAPPPPPPPPLPPRPPQLAALRSYSNRPLPPVPTQSPVGPKSKIARPTGKMAPVSAPIAIEAPIAPAAPPIAPPPPPPPSELPVIAPKRSPTKPIAAKRMTMQEELAKAIKKPRTLATTAQGNNSTLKFAKSTEFNDCLEEAEEDSDKQAKCVARCKATPAIPAFVCDRRGRIGSGSRVWYPTPYYYPHSFHSPLGYAERNARYSLASRGA